MTLNNLEWERKQAPKQKYNLHQACVLCVVLWPLHYLVYEILYPDSSEIRFMGNFTLPHLHALPVCRQLFSPKQLVYLPSNQTLQNNSSSGYSIQAHSINLYLLLFTTHCSFCFHLLSQASSQHLAIEARLLASSKALVHVHKIHILRNRCTRWNSTVKDHHHTIKLPHLDCSCSIKDSP